MVPSIDVKECDPSYDSTASIISIGNGVNDNHSVFQDGTCKAEQSILTNSLHPNNGFGRKMGISVDIINGAKTAPCSQEDIIIAGAGPVGLLLALRLAQQNIQTLVLEMNGNLNQAPRAIGYFGPTHHVFQEAGIYDKVAKDGMPSGGFCWRLPLVDDGSGGKLLGPIIAKNVMSKPDEKGEWPLGGYSIQLAQDKLSAILLEALEKTGKSKVLWNHKVSGLIQDARGVTVTAETSDGVSEYHGSYLVGADGGKSNVRKLLQIRLSGHSWPERFVATDIIRTTTDVTALPVHFTVDPLKWAVITPLERVVAGHRNLWRYSMAVSDPSIPDEEVMSPEYVDKLILDQLDGPRPSDHVVKRKSLYKMHQLIASTMTKGRCFLIGDAAHINNVRKQKRKSSILEEV